MRNPPDNNYYSSPDDRRPKNKPGGRRARTIRDMFALEEPLRRLTSAPVFMRRPNGAPPRNRRGNPPDLYDLEEHADASRASRAPNRKRTRWTEPGTWVREQQREPDRTDTRRPNRRPAPQPGAGAPNRSNPSGDLRWRQPDWLGHAPTPGDMPRDMPPTEPAPPTTPRYGPTYGPGDSETPHYQPSDYDSGRLKTDYRATSVRSALWASRTPGYQPDQPPVEAAHDTSSEHPYFDAYSAGQPPAQPPASLAHVGASMSADHAQAYTPGAVSEVERLRQLDPKAGHTGGPAPYFWEMVKKPRPASPIGLLAFWLMSALLICSALGTAAYAGVSLYAASQLVYAPQVPVKGTPADAGLAYKIVTFPSRTDHLELRGWFIPGVAGQGKHTTQETIIVVHGIRANRTDPGMGLLDLSDALAKAGFAVLAFDMRGSGESSSAPTSLGYYEQRDVLGAVDFLKSGPMPYPDLGRPKAIGGWGVSMGAATLLLAAAQEPSIRAVVSDSAYADVLPILEREIPARAHLPHAFTPGILEAANVMYGIDFSAVRPEAVVARIAPRPILFIHGAADTYVPPDNMTILAQAAQQAPNAHVQTWSVPNATHAQAFKVAGAAYVSRVVAFFKASLSTSGS